MIYAPAEDNHMADEGPCFGIVQGDMLREVSNTLESLSFISPIFQTPKSNLKGLRSLTKEKSEEISTYGERSTHDAILKMERRLNRSKRKIKEKETYF